MPQLSRSSCARPLYARPFGIRSVLPALLCAFALGGCQSTPQSEQQPPQDQTESRPEQTATERATSSAEQQDAQPESAAAAAAASEDAQSEAAAPASGQPANKSGASQSPPPAAGATAAERVEALDRELNASYGEHDALLRDQQASARADAEAIAAQRTQPGAGAAQEEEAEQGGLYEGLPGFGAPPPQGDDSGAESETASAQRSGESDDNGRTGGDGQAASSAHGAASNGQLGGATVPEDIPDGRDDDIVARQLREAAQMEKDPQLREKLWGEYRKYKNQQANR